MVVSYKKCLCSYGRNRTALLTPIKGKLRRQRQRMGEVSFPDLLCNRSYCILTESMERYRVLPKDQSRSTDVAGVWRQ